MADKDQGTKKASNEKPASAEELRDLDVLDEKITKVKGGAARKRRIGRRILP